MTRSFYHFIMTKRGPNEEVPETLLANLIEQDTLFPKQSQDYHEISHHLEMEGYLPSMSLFDEVWEEYRSGETSV
ncbi:MAG: YozE family protein [Streptococcaceae bacterium]|jgi:uncharacterized protein YozE (UPF0346 family)|nr:YozE family protein [Streptococcaceae bacterium]